MWAWLKGFLVGKGGGCIAANVSASATLTPLVEQKVSRRSFKYEQEPAKQNENLEAHGIQQDADVQQQPAKVAVLSTPLQMVGRHDSNVLADQQLDITQQLSAELPRAAGRYIYSGGKPVGFANTVTRYQENRAIKPHMTPFEARLEAKIAEEEVAAAAAAAGSRPNSADVTQRQLFNLGAAEHQHESSHG